MESNKDPRIEHKKGTKEILEMPQENFPVSWQVKAPSPCQYMWWVPNQLKVNKGPNLSVKVIVKCQDMYYTNWYAKYSQAGIQEYFQETCQV